MAQKLTMTEMVSAAFGAIFGVTLIPVIYTTVVSANVSIELALVLSLIPLAFVFGIANNVIRAMI